MSELDEKHWEAVEEATELLIERSFEQALEALRQVIAADGKNPYAFHYLGNALYELERLEPARDAYRAAIRLSPEYLGARLGLCHTLRLLGDTGAAVDSALETLRLFPGDGDALHATGLAYLAKGEPDKAKRYLTAFLDTKCEPEIRLEVVSLLNALEQDGQAEA